MDQTSISSRKPSWRDRLTSVSKKFGVGASPTRQYTSCERDRERGEEGENSEVSKKKGREHAAVDVDDWCVLDANGSDISVVVGETRELGEGVAILYSDTSAKENMEHTDGLFDRFRGSRKSEKVDGGKISTSSPTPPGVGGHGSRKSSFGTRLKPDGAKITRPGSPQPLQRRSSGRGRSKLDPHDNYHANGHASPRSTSPSRSSSGPASTRRKQSSSNPPSRTESPNLAEPRKQHDVPTGLSVRQTQNGRNGRGSPASSPSGESAFSKVRDTLKISKAKKKLKKKKKGSAYSVDPVEITFPDTKYQDPFEAQASYTDSLEVTSKAQSHDFKPVSIPHNKPEYCDHCSETAWGLYRQVLKCSICDFIVHRKCEVRVNIDCSSRLERAVLQRDQIAEENATAQQEEDSEKERKVLDASHAPTDQHDPSAAPSPSPSSTSSTSSSFSSFSSHHTNPQVLSEKAKLAKKIREYNRKTTPVNHIHIKGAHSQRDGAIEYVGFVRVHMCVQRPIHVSTAITRTSWYRLMRPVKERSEDAGLETAFYLPTDTNRLVHITNTTTTKELVQILLKKFCVTDNPKKFSLYEEYGGDYRRLFEEDNPLEIALEASVSNRNSKLILRDNTYSTIQWEAFTQPELNNFILILRREEELYIDKLSDRFKLWKECVSQAMKEKCKEEISRQTYLNNHDARNGAKASPSSLLDSRTTKA